MNARNQRALVFLALLGSCILGLLTLVVNNRDSSYFGLRRSRSDNEDNDNDYYNGDDYGFDGTYNGSATVLYPSPTPQSDSTCQALQQLADTTGTGLFTCVTHDQCTGLQCTIIPYGTFDMTVEPCNNPPAVHVVGIGPFGNVLFNETITKSREETFGPVIMNIKIVQSPNEDSITIRVDANITITNTIVPVIPETRIPLNRDQCGYTPPPITPTILIPHTSTQRPSPTPGVDQTCQALQQFATNSQFCSTSDQCAGVTCSYIGLGSFDAMVEPCHNPPALHVVTRDSTGQVRFNQTITKTQDQQLSLGTITYNVEQSEQEDAIIISVNFAPLGGNPVQIIPETRIPLNRDQCGYTPPPITPTQTVAHSHHVATTTDAQTSSSQYIESSPPQMQPTRTITHTVANMNTSSMPPTQSSLGCNQSTAIAPGCNQSIAIAPGGQQSIAIAVAVPVTILVVLLGIVVLAIVIVFAMRKYKLRQREYHFQRMTFDDVRDNDDDEDL